MRSSLILRLLLLILGVVQLVLYPALAGALLGWVLQVTGATTITSPVFWLAAAPALYLVWLVLLGAIFVVEVQLIHRRPLKVHRLSTADGTRAAFRLARIGALYRRAGFLETVPMAQSLLRLPWLRELALLTYAPSVHLGPGAQIWGALHDPDLTHIGAESVIGARAALVAHALNVMPEGGYVYISAPIHIGSRVNIGGEAFISMGVNIGDGSIIEARSRVEPFTRIPPGEVWGGDPAVFRRPVAGAAPAGAEPARAATAIAASLPEAATTGVAAALPEAVRAVVAEALCLPLEQVTDDLHYGSVPQWDSLGQMALAAALHDRLGVDLAPEAVFALRTLADVGRAAGVVPAAGVVARGRGDDGLIDLPADPEMLPLLDATAATRALAARQQGALPDDAATPVRVVVAATFVAEPMAPALRLWARAFGAEAEIEFMGFDQVPQALLDPASPFRANTTGLNVVLARPEDLGGRGGRDAAAAVLLDAMESFVATGAAPLVVGTLPPGTLPPGTLPSGTLPSGTESAAAAGDDVRVQLDALRGEWSRRLAATSGVEILDFAGVVERVGMDTAARPDMEALARAPYSPRLYQELGIAVARLVRRRVAPAAKVIAVDGDGTLWRGVVGEDGLAGVEVGDDGPGRAHRLLQARLRELRQRGVLLAVVSRNEEADVREVFRSHPGMLLGEEDVAAWKVGWEPKSKYLEALAAELNLGLDAIVFLDDDPAVRLEVQARTPAVHVVPLPADAALFATALSRLWLFDAGPATIEDRSRTRMVLQEQQRRSHRGSGAGLADYLGELQLEATLRPLVEADLPRAAQLTQKTNQFNLSLKRRSQEEIRGLADADTYVLAASDRYGEYGLIGLGILRPAGDDRECVELDTFLLSCRALGRGLEQAFLHGLGEAARRRGATRLRAGFVEGPRNQPVRRFLAESGFAAGAASSHQDKDTLELATDAAPDLPAHIRWQASASS